MLMGMFFFAQKLPRPHFDTFSKKENPVPKGTGFKIIN